MQWRFFRGRCLMILRLSGRSSSDVSGQEQLNRRGPRRRPWERQRTVPCLFFMFAPQMDSRRRGNDVQRQSHRSRTSSGSQHQAVRCRPPR